MVHLHVYNGFQIAGVQFIRNIEELDGFDIHNFPKTWRIDTITNYAALKHLVPSGKRYVGANDNDMNKAA